MSENENLVSVPQNSFFEDSERSEQVREQFEEQGESIKQKFDQYGNQVKSLSRVNRLFNTIAPLLLAWVFWNGRRNTDRDYCSGPAYSWGYIAFGYYALSGVLELKNLMINSEITNRINVITKFVSCLMYPFGAIVNFVLFIALLWSDSCPSMSGTLWTWFIVQLCSWLSCLLCCGIGGYSGFDMIKTEIKKAQQQAEPSDEKKD